MSVSMKVLVVLILNQNKYLRIFKDNSNKIWHKIADVNLNYKMDLYKNNINL